MSVSSCRPMIIEAGLAVAWGLPSDCVLPIEELAPLLDPTSRATAFATCVAELERLREAQISRNGRVLTDLLSSAERGR